MATKKGIALTVGILGAVIAASFLVYLIPEGNQGSVVISDFESHLDRVKGIHGVVAESLIEEFQNVLNQNINPQEYIEKAEVSSSQINSQIIQLVESKAPQEWQESYINYIESLKHFNSYIRETIVVAKMIEDGKGLNEIESILNKINELEADSKSLITASDTARP